MVCYRCGTKRLVKAGDTLGRCGAIDSAYGQAFKPCRGRYIIGSLVRP